MTVTLPYTLTAGQPENVNQLMSNLTTLKDAINTMQAAGVTADMLAAVVAAYVGVSQTGTVRRGKSVIATEEARTNVAYGKLTTPDQVSSVVLPTDGLICVAYHAMFKNSVTTAGRAAIFLGANQVKTADNGTAAPVVAEENGGNSAVDTYRPLYSGAGGGSGGTGLSLASSATAYTGDVTTGQLLGEVGAASAPTPGPVYIFAAAGTYDVSIQFRSTSGSVTVKERKLWVWTMGF